MTRKPFCTAGNDVVVGEKLTAIMRLWDVGDSPSESFRFPSVPVADSEGIVEVVRCEVVEAIQHQAELNPAKQLIRGR